MVVRRIFREYAAGRSPRAIAKDLNKEGIKGPRAAGWNTSTIHGNWRRGTGILNNELYIGRLVWNRQRYVKDPKTAKRIARPNPEAQWVIREVPELRIVSDELWRRVKERQSALRHKMERNKSRYCLNATHRRRYLLSGLLRCGRCAGTYSIVGSGRYGCSNHRHRGTCSNNLTIKRAELEERILSGLKHKLMAPELVEEFVREFTAQINRQAHAQSEDRNRKHRELEDVRRNIESILRALERGIITPTTKQRLLDLEARQDGLERELARHEPPPVRLHPNVAGIYRQKVERLQKSLDDPEIRNEASEALRTLIEEIRLTPEARGLRIELFGELAAILDLAQEKSRASDPETRLSLVAGACSRLYLLLFCPSLPVIEG